MVERNKQNKTTKWDRKWTIVIDKGKYTEGGCDCGRESRGDEMKKNIENDKAFTHISYACSHFRFAKTVHSLCANKSNMKIVDEMTRTNAVYGE